MSQTKTEHTKIINKTARSVLRPLGLFQKGRSRTWLDDNGWWVCVVEFQPSAWSRGTYLNVGCSWLWREQDHLSYDEGGRVEGFTEFKDPNQFNPVVAALTDRAVAKVKYYRSLFQSVQLVSDYYIWNYPIGFWSRFNAAVACGIAGRVSAAHDFFCRVLESNDDRDWVKKAQCEAKRLDSLLNDTVEFRRIASEKVVRARQLLNLPNLDTLTFDGP